MVLPLVVLLYFIIIIMKFIFWFAQPSYRKTSNISRTLGNKIIDNSDVVGASPVGAAPTTSSFSTYYLGSMDGQRPLQEETRNI